MRCLLPLLLCATSGCYFSGDPFVLITSTPAGAEIFIDGHPTGRTTPARIDLGGMYADDHKVTLRKEGFSEESRWVYHYTRNYTPRWIDGSSQPELPPTPIEWTIGDWFLPFGVKWMYVPHEVYAVLYGEGLAPVTTSDEGDG